MATREIEVESSNGLTTSNNYVQTIIAAVESIHASMPLVDFNFDPIDGQPTQWRYRFRCLDGRVWKQTVEFAVSATDPTMSFEFNDFFKLSEFTPHRNARNALVGAYAAVGLTRFVMRFP